MLRTAFKPNKVSFGQTNDHDDHDEDELERARPRPEWTTEIVVSEKEDENYTEILMSDNRIIRFRSTAEPEETANHLEEDEKDCDDSSTADELQDWQNDDDKTSSVDIIREAEAMKRYIFIFKIATFALLAIMAVTIPLAVYFIADTDQEDECEVAFTKDARDILEGFQNKLLGHIAGIAAFGVTMTSFAQHDPDMQWPFVTLNDFEKIAFSTRNRTGSLFLEVLPIVQEEDLEAWNTYSVQNKGWLEEGRMYQQEQGIPCEMNQCAAGTSPIVPYVFNFDNSESGIAAESGAGPFFPTWQQSPILPSDLVNYNAQRMTMYSRYLSSVAETGKISISDMWTAPVGGIDSVEFVTNYFANYLSFDRREPTTYDGEPMSAVFVPVVNSFQTDRNPVAVLLSITTWKQYFENLLPSTAPPAHVVLTNNCEDTSFTYRIEGPDVIFEGEGNRASSKYDDLMMTIVVDENESVIIEPGTVKLSLDADLCQYTLQVYATQDAYDLCNTNYPLTVALTVAAVFLFVIFILVVYDRWVQMGQRKLIAATAATAEEHSNAANTKSATHGSSTRPKHIPVKFAKKEHAPVQGNAIKLRTLANERRPIIASIIETQDSAAGDDFIPTSQPIADLFPDCTVMFGDIEGFTAWSSVREPSQVFILLESLYAAMDRIATKYRVFKVETVGDCYVAVCGLPESRDDNASVMALFARDCIENHIVMVKKLERTLGPDTGDLRLRVGLNSGPITAGVLRGRANRFQLFGDTVNTCARIESSGDGNKIHVSANTANLLIAAGHTDWVKERPDVVTLKGKGEMSTYWVNPLRRRQSYVRVDSNEGDLRINEDNSSSRSLRSSEELTKKSTPIKNPRLKKKRLITWNAELLISTMKRIVAHRQALSDKETTTATQTMTKEKIPDSNPLQEVVEIIELPQYDNEHRSSDSAKVHLDMWTTQMVFEFVEEIAAMYQDNPFHNFEHASHVTMSVSKLMSRIVAPSDMNYASNELAFKKLHDHTYGITSDPLTHFACIFSAMIHDADHQGVPNTTLVLEETPIAATYHGKSVAEQNSVDKAWNLLVSEKYHPLVNVLCRDEDELKRLRQLVVNSVMATDIMDPDLKKLRNARWDKAFKETADGPTNDPNEEQNRQAINRKATIVIEHLIQASDVSHTMQHWSVYTKWNACLFKEMYKAYLDGRAGAKDPSTFWAKGEIGFFDFYIIPLAKKLKDCGVFGVSSDEFLNYATSNRNEWETKGEAIVKNLVAQVHEEYGIKD